MGETIDLGFHHLFRPQDFLYRWVDEQYIVGERVLEAHWPTSQWRDGLSCDWSVLSGPLETAKRRAASLPAYVLQFSIQDCRDLQIKVRHCPVVARTSPNYNLAHCKLDPPDSGKGAIRMLREELQKRAVLLEIRSNKSHLLHAILRRLNPRYRAASRFIRVSTEKRESTTGLNSTSRVPLGTMAGMFSD